MLLCNYRKCKQPLKICAIATICRHIFCVEHNPSLIRTADGLVHCPVCRNRLKDNCEIMEVDLQPCEQFKTMILLGQSPETIFDICKYAIEFYFYQKNQEVKYYEYLNFKLNEKVKTIQAQCKSLLASYEGKNHRLQTEKDALAKECEELRDNLVAAGQKISQLESNLRKLSIQKLPAFEKLDDGHPRPVLQALSDETVRSKFPRCSPDSTCAYASPVNSSSIAGFQPFNFRKRLESFNIFAGMRPSPMRASDRERTMQDFSENPRNHSMLSIKNLFR
ncbi:unnamed protein product [Dicrocoelium dendriticum]|nr:unnamed protein product [Dicrocoelium dendriticum]